MYFAHTCVLEEFDFDILSFQLIFVDYASFLVPLGVVKGQMLQLRRHPYVSPF